MAQYTNAPLTGVYVHSEEMVPSLVLTFVHLIIPALVLHRI